MVGAPSFSHPEYWESRFKKDPSAFDWLLSPNCLDKHVLEALAAVASSSSDPLSPQQPCIHHIGCGTSAMSFQLRRLVDDPAQVLNTDYSPAAVEIGERREREVFGDNGLEVVEQATRRRRGSASVESSSSGLEEENETQTRGDRQRRRDDAAAARRAGSKNKTMRWSTIDLLSLADTARLAREPPYPPYAVIVDKSTSDCISCVDDVTVTLPYALQPVESSTTSTAPTATAAADPPTTAQIHPLHLLAVHLAYHMRPGGRWLAVSYSGARFPFLPPYPDRADEGKLSDETVERGFVHPGRLWRLERHEMVHSEEDEGKEGATVVHRPRIVHHLYVLVRTDLRLEMVGRAEWKKSGETGLRCRGARSHDYC